MDKNILFADILKAYDHLNVITFKVLGNEYKFYYRHLTILEHTRIKIASIKKTTTINADGSTTEREEEQKHLYPLYTILEKALDENGKKLFSLTSKDDYDKISKLPMELLSMISAEMSFDITGNISSLLRGNNG